MKKIKIGYNKLFEIQKICLRVSEFDQNIQKQKPILIKRQTYCTSNTNIENSSDKNNIIVIIPFMILVIM